MRAAWTNRLAAREGLANARTGGRLSGVVVVVVALVACGLGLANALDVTRLVRAEERWIDAGAFVSVVESGSQVDGAVIDAAACDRLARVDGIEASFGVTVRDTAAEPAHAPGTRATIAVATPGVYRFLGAREPRAPGILVPPEAAAQTGLVDGEVTRFLLTSSGGVPVAEIEATAVLVGESALAEQLLGAYILPVAPTGSVAQCYVRSDAGSLDAVRQYVGAALASPDGTPAVARPRLSGEAYGIDFSTAYHDRVLAWAWPAGAVVLAALWAALQRTRRARWAIYATFGADARARLVVQATEWAALSLVGAVWGWAIAVAFAVGLGGDAAASLKQVTGQVAATWCAASVGVAVVGLRPVGSLLDALKDRT